MSSSLAINGTLTRGQDVRHQHVMAALAVANIVKSSLGPVGLDKMLVDEVGDVTITNDGATILKQLEVEHPAAKVLVELSNLQDQEVGDGTTSVVIMASEMLRQANELVKNNVHPTSIIAGFLLAKKEACKYIAKNMAQKVADLPQETILNCAKTSISSKILSADSEFFANLAVDCVTAVKSTNSKGRETYPVSAISILKAHGKSWLDSERVDGYALNASRSGQGMPTKIKQAKIALLDIDLRKTRLAMGIEVLVTDPKKLADIRQKETDITNDRIKMILKAGANVVLTTKGIDDTSLKLFVEAGVMAVRRCSRADLRGIAKCTGGKLILSLGDMEGNESVDPKMFGEAESVEERRVGDGELIYVLGCKNTRAQTIVLRGANDFMLDEIERSLHDCMMVVKRVLESKSVVPGGGCVEGALSVYMEHIADTMGSREQLAIAAFARSLLIIPKTLAVNGAYDATDLVAKLRAYHNAAQTNDNKKKYKWTGLDLENGKVRNNLEAGVLEPAISKIKMIRFATEAAVTILRIDDAIKLNPAADPNNPQGDGY
jgi:T-complex protein 1 subunit alpha